MQLKILYRDYWNAEFTYCPYQGVIHSTDDEEINFDDMLKDAMKKEGIGDGDEVEIVIRRTGERPHGQRRWRLTKPHTYSPVDAQEGAQKAAGGALAE